MRIIRKNKLRPNQLFPIICGLLSLFVQPAHSFRNFDLRGFGELHYAPRLDKPSDPAINRQRIRLDCSTSLHSFRFNTWVIARGNGNTGIYPDWQLLVPEVYGEYHGGPLFLRVGKQQIVWGAADGLFINDIINPLDLREFLLPDLEDVRLAQPSLRAQYQLCNWLLEGVWIWKFQSTKLPAEFLSQQMPVNGIPLKLLPVRNPVTTLGNSEFGLRVSTMVGRWDISLNYFRSWRDLPTIDANVRRSENSVSPVLELKPFYQRISTLGGSFSYPKGPVLLRGEFSLVPNLQIENFNSAAPSTLISRDFLTYFLGMDLRIKRARIGLQFAQEVLFGDIETTNRDKIDNVLTLLFERSFYHDAITCLVFMNTEFDQRDMWVRGELSYRLNNKIKLSLGSHVFAGRKTGRLGRLHDRSNAFFKFKYSFAI